MLAILDTGTTDLSPMFDSRCLCPARRSARWRWRRARRRARLVLRVAPAAARKGRRQYPLICTSEHLEWFDSDAEAMERSAQGKARRRLERGEAASGGEGVGSQRRALLSSSVSEEERKPHVLFLGLAFLDGMQLTIDLDERRMLAATRRA